MNFFGKKGGKDRRSQAQPAAEFKFDLRAPDAFSEENLAKMSGVDTMTFDENDPTLMAELAELGWEDDAGGGSGGVVSVAPGHRPRPNAPTPGSGGKGPTSGESGAVGASAAPARQQGGNELLRSLGLSLNSMGDTELTERDLQDPDLLKELGEVSSDVDFEEETTTAGQDGAVGGAEGHADDEAVEPDRAEDVSPPEYTSGTFAGTLPDETLEAMLEDDDLEHEATVEPEPVQAAAPSLPPRKPPAAGAPRGSSGGTDSEIIRLEEKAERLRRSAVDLNKNGPKFRRI